MGLEPWTHCSASPATRQVTAAAACLLALRHTTTTTTQMSHYIQTWKHCDWLMSVKLSLSLVGGSRSNQNKECEWHKQSMNLWEAQRLIKYFVTLPSSLYVLRFLIPSRPLETFLLRLRVWIETPLSLDVLNPNLDSPPDLTKSVSSSSQIPLILISIIKENIHSQLKLTKWAITSQHI